VTRRLRVGLVAVLIGGCKWFSSVAPTDESRRVWRRPIAPASCNENVIAPSLAALAARGVAALATDGQLIAFDATTGAERWRIRDSMFLVDGGGSFSQGATGVAVHQGSALAFDLTTGAIRWTRRGLPSRSKAG